MPYWLVPSSRASTTKEKPCTTNDRPWPANSQEAFCNKRLDRARTATVLIDTKPFCDENLRLQTGYRKAWARRKAEPRRHRITHPLQCQNGLVVDVQAINFR